MAGRLATTNPQPQPQGYNSICPAATNIGDRATVNQIYALVNNVFKQMTGRTDIEAVDTNSLVAMGNELENLGRMDIYLGSLSRRIGLTIDSYRTYDNDFSEYKRNSFEWGAAVQKLYADMPDAVEDLTYKVGQMDGQSVDHYIINNPKVQQKIFEKVTPYSFYITIQDYLLREAFLSAGQMYSLINYIFGQCQNKMEVVHEDLARLALANIAVNVSAKQVYNLRSMYNQARGMTLTLGDALFDPDFLRYAIGIMNNVSRKMTKMSVLYNSEDKYRFTPYSKQSMFVISDFQTRLETVVQYAAFNEQYVKLRKFISLPYWQAIKDGEHVNDFDVTTKIIATNSAGAETTLSNLVGCIIDYETFGTFRQEQRVATTPVNARALYYNTFWHERQMYFNDLGENAVFFTLN